ncbi:hypothetical protein JOD02_001757 [Caldicoprobacter guelmensis]|nr:hypothetical protein [Caldicoprobacter guelmensis]
MSNPQRGAMAALRVALDTGRAESAPGSCILESVVGE